MHLRYCMISAHKIDSHPQDQMRKLGITYQHSTPQSMGDQWWFWNCENVPRDLPKYLEGMKENPMKCIGFGLSKKDAERIIDYKREK